MRRSDFALAILMIGLMGVSRAGAQTGANGDVVTIGKSATALVEVTAPGNEEGSTGTAFCIDKSGLFITNSHVIGDAEGGRADIRIVLEPGPNRKRQSLRARIVRSDERLDLALLRVDSVPGLTPLELGRDDKLRETMPVTTFGYPFGAALAFRRGGYPDITVLQSKITALRHDKDRLEKIQFDNQLNPGNSGGPVLGPDGKVVGVAQATVPGKAINFAIPVGRLRDFLKAPALVFNPPPLAYSKRTQPVTWTINVQPTTASTPLPEGLSVSVTIATDVAPPRTYDATSMGKGNYRVTITPVPPEAQTPVELRVLFKGRWLETAVTDRTVHVGKASFLLSDLEELVASNPPRVTTRKRQVVFGPITNLPKAKVPSSRPGKPVSIDLSQAAVIQVGPSAAAKPLRAIEATIELKMAGEVVATKERRIEFPDAPILLIDRARREIRIIPPTAAGVMRTSDPETHDVVMEMGGNLKADGLPLGAGLGIRPASVPMGDAILSDARKPEQSEPLVRQIGGKATDLAVGGGGRYLILVLKSARQLVVFDVTTAEIVKRIDFPAEDVLLAAGAETLVVLFPKEKLIQRYSLMTMEAEIPPKRLPIRSRIESIAMGCDSRGPLLAYWTVQRGEGPASGTSRFSFIDPLTLKILRIDPKGYTPGGAVMSEGAFRLNPGTFQHRIQMRATPNGALFAVWSATAFPSGIATVGVHGGSLRIEYKHEAAGSVVPAPDGQTLLTGYGGRRRIDGSELSPTPRPCPSAETLIPALDTYYINVHGFTHTALPSAGPISATLHLLSNDAEIVTIREMPEMAGTSRQAGGHPDGLVVDKRFHFIPAARLFITIPPTNDRLVLRRLDIDQAIARSEKPLLLVTSPGELSVRPRQEIVHQVQARSSKGPVRFELTSGPAGLSVSSEGMLSWRAPIAGGNEVHEAVVTISDASGRQIFHTIRIKVQ
jgi:S1-C subfamily serine protease